MRRDRVFATILSLAVSLACIGCSGTDGDDNDKNNKDKQKDQTPLELSKEMLGVGFHHGEAGALQEGGSPGKDVIDSVSKNFSTAFLHVQTYDEHAWKFGEWTNHPHPNASSSDYRGLTFFKKNPGKGRFKPRVADLAEEVSGAFGKKAFANFGIVLDFWRMRQDWYVRWDGNLEEDENLYGEGSYGFFRKSMTDSLITQIREAAAEHKPAYMVIGTDMGRLLAREDKPGLAPDDFSNFKQFYRAATAEIGKASRQTKVGAGFNWDHFARYVAPQYGPEKKGEVPSDETLALAFERAILPFAEVGGVIALASYRSAEGEAGYYEFLATLDDRFDLEETELIWYSIGSPVTSSTSYRPQNTYLEKFIEWNKGVEPEIVAWRSLLNIDGADRANQMIGGRCKQLIDNKKFQLDKHHCFDGLYTTLLQSKDVYDSIVSETK